MEQLSTDQSEVSEQDLGLLQHIRRYLGLAATQPRKEKPPRTIADEVPKFLDLGPQRYGDPGFLAPSTDGPLLEDENFQEVLEFLGTLESPHEHR